ncbi:HAD-IIA family hydrolase [Galbitalea sp. SE-J8]|uniref:HAD-IIA family hydrolase n=1 Tax=Galbitalea sp. SE-J8 TaxID=3054952 RepID=UPI00259CF311|nr:HAD-IIA family hydrolase [Galbitalea sp. SE-J8]MDM4764313.1 HAD-IIA family hydrolase [Galbitalea sp. SE-J8]
MALGRRRTDPAPIDGVDTILADLDGVVYTGPGAIPHAVEALERARASARVGYITNNASRTDATVAEHLTGLGLTVVPSDVVTSPQAAVRLLADLVPAASVILVVGGDGLVAEVEKAGFRVTRSADDAPAAVVQGFAPHVGWEQLAEAAFALQGEHAERPWVATNTDWTIPVARGIAPGNGTLVSAVHTAVGRLPRVAGKPETPMFTLAVERFGATHALVVGDRLDTDILGANRAGLASAHVLTGVDRVKQLLAAVPDQRPTFVLEHLGQLFEPYPAAETAERRDVVTTRVAGAEIERRGDTLTVTRAGDRRIDLVRAGAAAIWGSGIPIYGLRVPAELYSDA